MVKNSSYITKRQSQISEVTRIINIKFIENINFSSNKKKFCKSIIPHYHKSLVGTLNYFRNGYSVGIIVS